MAFAWEGESLEGLNDFVRKHLSVHGEKGEVIFVATDEVQAGQIELLKGESQIPVWVTIRGEAFDPESYSMDLAALETRIITEGKDLNSFSSLNIVGPESLNFITAGLSDGSKFRQAVYFFLKNLFEGVRFNFLDIEKQEIIARAIAMAA